MKCVKKSKLPLSVVILTLAFMTSACATTAPDPVVIDTWCLNDREISYDSTADTEQTVAEIRAHNVVLHENCKDEDDG